MTHQKERIETEVTYDTAQTLRKIAEQHGQSIEDYIAALLESYADAQQDSSARSHVVRSYLNSHARFASLYERLAK
jgi:hypothetical protein